MTSKTSPGGRYERGTCINLRVDTPRAEKELPTTDISVSASLFDRTGVSTTIVLFLVFDEEERKLFSIDPVTSSSAVCVCGEKTNESTPLVGSDSLAVGVGNGETDGSPTVTESGVGVT